MRLLWILLFLLLTGCDSSSSNKQTSSDKQSPAKGRRTSLVATIIESSKMQTQVRGIGTLIASEQVEIKSEIAGRIQKINFREGQVIQKGALLAQLNNDDLNAQKAKAQSTVSLQQAILTRRKQQLDLHALSQQDYEQSVSDLASAQADLALVEANIAKTKIVAPFSGVLGLRNVSVGAVVSTGQAITTLVQLSPLKVDMAIPGEFTSYAKPGQKVGIRAVNGKEYQARIYATAGFLNQTTRNLTVRAIVESKSKDLVPGSAVEYAIDIPQVEGILVPPEAIAGDSKGSIVYLYKNGKAMSSPVKLGKRTVESIQIIEGVSLGDTVLCVGATNMRNGMPVEITHFR